MISEDDTPGNVLTRWISDNSVVAVIVESTEFGFASTAVVSAESDRLVFASKRGSDNAETDSWRLTVLLAGDFDFSPVVSRDGKSLEFTIRLKTGGTCMLIGPRPIIGSVSLQ